MDILLLTTNCNRIHTKLEDNSIIWTSIESNVKNVIINSRVKCLTEQFQKTEVKLYNFLIRVNFTIHLMSFISCIHVSSISILKYCISFVREIKIYSYRLLFYIWKKRASIQGVHYSLNIIAILTVSVIKNYTISRICLS